MGRRSERGALLCARARSRSLAMRWATRRRRHSTAQLGSRAAATACFIAAESAQSSWGGCGGGEIEGTARGA